MADEHQNEHESRFCLEDLPAEVRQLADTMIGVNPNWNIQDWLIEQANMSMDLLAADLLREKMKIEQRLRRLDDLGRRLDVSESETSSDDPHQRNLFDCFDLNEEHPLRGLGERAVAPQESNETDERHPSNIFLDLLPNDNSDDPLLAIACQSVIMAVENEMSKGEPVASLASIFEATRESNIEDSETDEALDHLLSTSVLLEIDDDCFILLPS